MGQKLHTPTLLSTIGPPKSIPTGFASQPAVIWSRTIPTCQYVWHKSTWPNSIGTASWVQKRWVHVHWYIIFFTCPLPSSSLNICAYHWTCSQVEQSYSTICTNMPTKALYTLKWDGLYGVSHRQVSWQTSVFGRNLPCLAISNATTLRDCGTTNRVLFCLCLLLKISESNMMVNNTPCT